MQYLRKAINVRLFVLASITIKINIIIMIFIEKITYHRMERRNGVKMLNQNFKLLASSIDFQFSVYFIKIQ